jgi:hypothetical protein
VKKLFIIKISANGIVKHFRMNPKAIVIKCHDAGKIENFDLEAYIERYSQFICSINENNIYSELDNFIEGEKLLFNNKLYISCRRVSFELKIERNYD